ncbi:MAG: hypothetical protein ACTS22_08685 [Phycisphaerales bacterium]
MHLRAPRYLVLATLAGTAAADPQDDLFDDFIVRPNDRASFNLVVANETGQKQDAFIGDPASVPLGTLNSQITAGQSTAGNYSIDVGWDEFFDNASPGQGVASRIRFDFATSDGSPFVSQQDFNNGFRFIQWEIGDHLDPADQAFADPITFKPTITSVTLVQATAVFFQGDIVQNSIHYGFTLNPNWDGTDAVPGNIFTLDATTNRIEVTYDYIPVPAPASFAMLVGAGGLAVRRRRA